MRASAAMGIPALGLLALACASTQLVQSELRSAEPLAEDCIVSTIRSDSGVVGFRDMGPHAGFPSWWFQIRDPELAGKPRPSQRLSQRSVAEGWALDLAANFRARSREAPRQREVVLRNQQQLLERVASQCAGARVEFGPGTVCGRGAEHTLCSQGELRDGR